MESSFLIGILNNISLLLALGFLYSLCTRRWDTKSTKGKLIAGFLFGAVGMLGMLFPLPYSPGITFDGRTILLGIIGLFGGWPAAAVAVVMTGTLRIWQGGAGQWIGLATIVSAALLGVVFRFLQQRFSLQNGIIFLYGFGIVVHLTMLACMLFFPADISRQILSDITFPVLLIYPVATMLYGRLIVELEERNLAADELQESESKYRQLFEMESDALFLIDNETGDILDANVAAVQLYGYSHEELLKMKNTQLSAEPEKTQKAAAEAGTDQVIEIPLRYHRKKDGTIFPVEISAASLMRNGRPAHIPAIRDITGRVQAEKAIRHSAEIQTVLREIAEAALLTSSMGELYRTVYQLLERVLPAKLFHVNLLDESSGEIVVPFNADGVSAIPERRPVNKGMTEYIMRLGHAVHITPEEILRLRETGEYSLSTPQNMQGYHYLGAPLIDSEGKPFGVISLIVVGAEQSFHPEDVELLSIIAAQVAMAIERKQAEERILESESRIRAITDSAKDAILMMNPQGEISYWNPAATRIFGYAKDEVMGRNLHQLLTPLRYQDSHEAVMQDFLQMGRGNSVGTTRELEACHKDGHEIAVELSLSTIQLLDGWHSIGILRDITERNEKRAKIEYLSFHDQLTGLYNRRYYEEELKRLSTERNLPITLVMADVNGLKLTNDAFGHIAGDNLLKQLSEVLKSVCRADDIVARIGGDEFVLLLPMTDSKETRKIVQRISEALSQQKGDSIILSVSFGWATKTDPSMEMTEVFKMAEDDMYRQKLSESDSMRNSTINIIVKTLNAKNEREERHSSRVSEVCKAIGIAMSFNKNEADEMKTAGLLHDIGKIGIDEKVLNKEGVLTDDEWREMKRHSEIGYRILGAVPEFSHLARFVLEHHERWDGKGYPKGLKEEEICLEARILAVADSYDAMTSERSYRSSLSLPEVIEELRRNAGSQFDPVVASFFVEKVLGEKF